MCSDVLATAAQSYASGSRHIGHISGFDVPSDVSAHYVHMVGHSVLTISESDEHGTAIQTKADSGGLATREYADKYRRAIVSDLQRLELSYDLYTRITTPNHYQVVQEVFKTLYDNGYVTAQIQMGAISPSTGRILPDRLIGGIYPICGYTDAHSDQCDDCGNQLDPTDLISPVSHINGETPWSVETEHFFLNLSEIAEQLTAWLDSHEDQRPSASEFNHSLLEKIRPGAITRDLDWGVPVSLKGWMDAFMKCIYVWFDVVTGYLSTSIEWARHNNGPDAWWGFWSEETAQSFHFVGKDNIIFHSIIWSGILLGANEQEAVDDEIKLAPGEL